MLSEFQTHILKELYPREQLTEANFEIKFHTKSDNPSIKTLFRENLLYLDSSRLYKPKLIYLTEKGRAYVEGITEEKEDKKFYRFHTWANTVIAMTALLMAIPALILSLMQLLK